MPVIDILIIALIVVALSGLRIAQEYERGVVFRLGRYKGLRGPGLYWIIPLGIERAVRIDIRTRTVSAEQQETITRDSVTIKVNAVLWYRIVDAAKAVIEVADAPAAVYQLALTGLRNIIGQHDLDEILQERNKINTLLSDNISGSTAAWGLRGAALRDEGCGTAQGHAAGDGHAGRSDPRKARAHHQGRGRTRGFGEAVGRRRADHRKSCRAGTAAHADDFRGGRREQQHHGPHDPVGFRVAGAQPQ